MSADGGRMQARQPQQPGVPSLGASGERKVKFTDRPTGDDHDEEAMEEGGASTGGVGAAGGPLPPPPAPPTGPSGSGALAALLRRLPRAHPPAPAPGEGGPSIGASAPPPAATSTGGRLSQTVVLGRTAAGGFGPEELELAWTRAHEGSVWWGDSVILSRPPLQAAIQARAATAPLLSQRPVTDLFPAASSARTQGKTGQLACREPAVLLRQGIASGRCVLCFRLPGARLVKPRLLPLPSSWARTAALRPRLQVDHPAAHPRGVRGDDPEVHRLRSRAEALVHDAARGAHGGGSGGAECIAASRSCGGGRRRGRPAAGGWRGRGFVAPTGGRRRHSPVGALCPRPAAAGAAVIIVAGAPAPPRAGARPVATAAYLQVWRSTQRLTVFDLNSLCSQPGEGYPYRKSLSTVARHWERVLEPLMS